MKRFVTRFLSAFMAGMLMFGSVELNAFAMEPKTEEKTLVETSEELSEAVSEDDSPEASEKLSEAMSEDQSEVTSEAVSEKQSEVASEEASEEMSEERSEKESELNEEENSEAESFDESELSEGQKDGAFDIVDISSSVMVKSVYNPDGVFYDSEGNVAGLTYTLYPVYVYPAESGSSRPQSYQFNLRNNKTGERLDYKKVSVSKVSVVDGYAFAECAVTYEQPLGQNISGDYRLEVNISTENKYYTSKVNLSLFDDTQEDSFNVNISDEQVTYSKQGEIAEFTFNQMIASQEKDTIKSVQIRNQETNQAQDVNFKVLSFDSTPQYHTVEIGLPYYNEVTIDGKKIKYALNNYDGNNRKLLYGGEVSLNVNSVKALESGNYDVLVTTSSGKTTTYSNAVVITSKPIIRGIKECDVQGYSMDCGEGYIAYEFLGDNLDENFIPRLYSDENLTKTIASFETSDPKCRMMPEGKDGRVYILKIINPSFYTKNESQSAYCVDTNTRSYYPGITENYLTLKVSSNTDRGVYRVVFDDISADKRIRLYLNRDNFELSGYPVTVFYSDSKVWSDITNVNVTEDSEGHRYADVPMDSNFAKHFFSNKSFSIVNQMGEEFQCSILPSMKLSSVTDVSVAKGSWSVRNPLNYSVICSGGSGAEQSLNKTADSEQKIQMALLPSVLIEKTDESGITSVTESKYTGVKISLINYYNDCNLNHKKTYLLEGDTLTADEIDEPVCYYIGVENYYEFKGWYLDRELTKKLTSITAKDGKEINLYAKWEPVNFAVIVSINDTDFTMEVPYGPEFNMLPKEYNHPGYEISEWVCDGKSFKKDIFTMDDFVNRGLITKYDADKTIRVKGIETPVKYTLSLNLNSVTDVTFDKAVSNKSVDFTVESDDFSIPVPSSAEYEFDGWYKEPTFVNKIETVNKGTIGDLTVYAKWKVGTYEVNYDVIIPDGCKVTSSKSIGSQTHFMGEVFTIPSNVYSVAPIEKTDKHKYVFVGWSVTPDGPVLYKDKETISFIRDKSAPDSLKTEGKVTLYANFRSSVTVNFEVYNPVTDVTTNYSKPIYYQNGKLEAVTMDGFDFLYWYDEENSRKVTSVTTKDIEELHLKAYMKERSFKVVYNMNGGSCAKKSDTVLYSESLTFPTQVTLPGYSFEEWTFNGEKVSNPNSFKVSDYSDLTGTMKNNSTITITATWKCEEILFNLIIGGDEKTGYVRQGYGLIERDKELEISMLYPDVEGVYADPQCKKKLGTFLKEDEYGGSTVKLKKGANNYVVNGEINLYVKQKGTYELVLHSSKNPDEDVTETYHFSHQDFNKTIPTPKFTNGSLCVESWTGKIGFIESTVMANSAIWTYNKKVDLYANWTEQYVLFTDKNRSFSIIDKYTTGELVDPESKVLKHYNSEPVAGYVGYEFVGYSTNPDKMVKPKFTKTTSGIITLYAIYKPKNFTIIYKMGDKQVVQKSNYGVITKIKGYTDKKTLKTKKFDGWLYDGKIYQPGDVLDWNSNAHDTEKEFIPVLSDHGTISFAFNEADAEMISDISFDYNYGTAMSAKDFAAVSKAFRLGYKLAGWYYDADCKKAFKSIPATLRGDYVLYAKWVPETTTVLFDMNAPVELNKTPAMIKQTLKYGENKALLKNKYKVTGYKLVGWSLTPNGAVVLRDGDVFNAYDIMNREETYNGFGITLYAQWEKETYSINYQNITGFDLDLTNYYTVDGCKLETPQHIGYSFVGWYSDKACKKPVKEIAPGTTGNITLYAKWIPMDHS